MKIRIVTIFLFFICTTSLFAQKTADATTTNTKESVSAEDKFAKRRFIGMVIAGFNMTQVDGDRMAGYYNFGFNGGVGAFAKIGKRFSISMELLYNMKGAKSQLNYAKINARYITLDYADIPVMFNFHDKQIAIFGAGFSVGGLIRKKQTIYDQSGNVQSELKYTVNGQDKYVNIESYMTNYRAIDFQVVGHATFLIKKRIGVQARFGYSLLGLGKAPFIDGNLRTGQQRNNVLSLRLFYMI